MTNRPFPQPIRLPGMRPKWRLSDIERYENGGTARTVELERWLSAPQLAERYGVTRVAIWQLAKKSEEAA